MTTSLNTLPYTHINIHFLTILVLFYKFYKVFKKRKGTLGLKFCSARVDLWNELDDSTVSVDNVTAFKRKLGELEY